MVRAVRGAIQIDDNKASSIEHSVTRLVEEVLLQNSIPETDIISIIFSQTRDITAFNPAAALRKKGYALVPLFCTQEPEYHGALLSVIRILVTYNSEAADLPKPVYLNGAEVLRQDLLEK